MHWALESHCIEVTMMQCVNCTIRFHVCVHNQIVYKIVTQRPPCERCIWEYFQLNAVHLNSNIKQIYIHVHDITVYMYVLMLPWFPVNPFASEKFRTDSRMF